jgi:AcrR family transcriptional regulator
MPRLPAAQRREQLLDVALDLFSRYGYARTTTAQMARAAGVTEPIIYRHFSSKKDLFIALIERTGRETLTDWERDLAGAPDAAGRLAVLLGDNPMVSGKGSKSYRVILQAISEIEDDQIRHALQLHFGKVHEFIKREILAAQDENTVARRFSGDNIAWILTYLGLGYGMLSAMGVDGHGRDADGRHVKDAIARMLVRRDAAEPQKPESPKPPDSPDSPDASGGNIPASP